MQSLSLFHAGDLRLLRDCSGARWSPLSPCLLAVEHTVDGAAGRGAGLLPGSGPRVPAPVTQAGAAWRHTPRDTATGPTLPSCQPPPAAVRCASGMGAGRTPGLPVTALSWAASRS